MLTPRATRWSPNATRCWRRRSWPAPVRNCATPPPMAAISTSAPAAIIFTIRPPPATSASRVPAAAPSAASRIHAILGATEQCIATHPSDMCVALAALDAQVHVTGPQGSRVIPFADYHRLPGDEPQRDNTLHVAELVTAIDVPPADFGRHTTYLKLRDRLSYAFALVSVAAAMRVDANGVISDARVALGGVAPKPWRVPAAEALLEQATASRELFSRVAERLLQGAVSQGDNGFKIELARRAIVRALTQAAEGRPQSQSDKRIA